MADLLSDQFSWRFVFWWSEAEQCHCKKCAGKGNDNETIFWKYESSVQQ